MVDMTNREEVENDGQAIVPAWLAELIGALEHPQPQILLCAECMDTYRTVLIGLTRGEEREVTPEESAHLATVPVNHANTLVGGHALCWNHLPVKQNPAVASLFVPGGMPRG